MPQKYDELPVFKAVYDVLLKTLDAGKRMTRDYRYTIGEDVKRALFRVQVLVYHANKAKDKQAKVQYIDEALEKMVEVKLLYRILHDSKQVSVNQYAQIAFDLVAVERQLEAWRKYYELASLGNR